MPGLAIGGWFAAVGISKLADQAISYVKSQIEYEAGVKEKLQKLHQHLTAVEAVVHAADSTKIENRRLDAWLGELKDAAHAAEDVLDNFECQLLEEKVMGLNQVRSDVASSSYNLAGSTTTFFKRILFRDEDINELGAVVQRFDSIVSNMGTFVELVKLDMGTSQRHDTQCRETTSIPDESKIVGRNDEIEDLVNLLTKEVGDGPMSSLPVTSIVGIGGVGKTTLAQFVYNNDKVDKFFKPKVWLCISDDFDLLRITKEIIESASIEVPSNFHDFKNLDKLQGFIRDGLSRKRFLIVLDDVWNEVFRKWEILRTAFMCGKEGSRVLVTTRNRGIAAMMTTERTIALEGLKGGDYESFFTQCAFGNANPEYHPKLEFIGRGIAAKLGGSPLAAKTVGGLLKQNLQEEYWREILQSTLCHLDGILPALRLSYEHLPAHLKQCFVYCSLFPKDFRFDRDELVRIWMAQGFILPNSGRKRLEDVGRDYFQNLSSRSFFQIAAGSGNRYVIHDLMHDLALSISADEYLIIKGADPFEVPRRVRHLSLAHVDMNKVRDIVPRIRASRSLVIFGHVDYLLQSVIEELKSLRVVIMPDFLQVCHLRHLRYMSISSHHINEDFKSLCGLYHLQGLSLPTCSFLAKEMNQLINLRYLNARLQIIRSIPDIGRLTSLQELREFHVNKEPGYELRQLRDMRQLRGRLWITNLQNVKTEDDITDAVLVNKEHLTSLQLEWRGTGHLNPEVVLESLQPHGNLKELKIKGYSGARSPSWLENNCLANLEYISLHYCRNWELPPLAQLLFLKVLEVIDMRAVKQIGREFYGSNKAFLSLEVLKFEDMWNLEVWTGPEEGWLFFPRLRKIHIRNCPNLKCPLPLPSWPKKLEILCRNNLTAAYLGHSQDTDSTHAVASFVLVVDNASLLTRWLPVERLSALEHLEIKDFPLLTSFTSEQEEWLQKLISLKHLVLSSCVNLSSLPTNLETLPSLERLLIHDCCAIRSLPEKGLPASLKELHIKLCNQTLKERCQAGGLDWQKIAHIPTICIESKGTLLLL